MTRKVVVNDKMQSGHVYYRTEPVGCNFAPGFTPELTPKRMLALGVFGGKYMTDCRGEFPASRFARARLCAERHDPRLNYFGVNASQSLAGSDARAGSTSRIRADGFSGTAGITWAAGRATTRDRYAGGVPSRGTSRPFGSIATRETSTAGGGSGRPRCTWRITAASSDVFDDAGGRRFASASPRVCHPAFALADACPNKELTGKVVEIGHRMGRKNVYARLHRSLAHQRNARAARRRRRAAVGVVLLTVGFAQILIPLDALRVVVASMLTMLGLHRLWNHRHPRFGGMEVGFRDLTVWSFLMASAHGAGFMVVPFVMSAPPMLSAAGHEHAHHIAAAGANVAGAGMMAVAVHTLAYFAVMTIAAWGVHRKLGLGILRKTWLNMDWVWAGALVLTGVVVLLK